MLTSYQVIKDRIKSGWLPNEKNYVYQQLLYQLGQEIAYKESRRGLEGNDLWGDGLTYFPAIEILDILKGQSRKPLNASYLMQSRVMGDVPEPMFPQLDPFSGEIRKQYCMQRPFQRYGFGEWFPSMTATFNDADGLGYSCTQIGQRECPIDKKRTPYVQHISPLNVIWDPLVPHPAQSTWAAVIHYLTPDDVADLYGGKRNDLIKNSRRAAFQTVQSKKWDVVRVIEYFDVGTGKGEPTYAVIVGFLDGERSIVMREFNAREDIPLAWMVNFVAPGMSRPVGRVHLQFQSSKMLNLLESYMFRTLAMAPDVDLIFQEAINSEDWKDLQAGKMLTHLRLTKHFEKSPWHRIEKKDIPRTVLTMLDYYNREYTEDSGLSELSRGVMPDKVRSATEMNLVESNSTLNQGWTPREATRYMIRFYSKLVNTARDEEEKPIIVDYKGHNLPLNSGDERYPNLTVRAFMEEPSLTLIDRQAVTAADDEVKRQRRLVFLERVLATGIPVDGKWLAEEYLRAGGQDDAKIAMGQAGTNAPMTGMNPSAMQTAVTGMPATLPIGM